MQPTQLGPYTIGTRLGRGGMGAVYEATDGVGQSVAVKVLAGHLADDPGLRRRFDTEIATLKSLRHPGIVQLLAFGEQDDQPYFAMELVPGKSLEQMLRAGRRFTWQETLSVALAVARALKVAHDHGVIHRDLKPANLLVADGDATDDLGSRVKLADFGIAKLFGGAAHTAHGNVVGTAEYMAPEQAAGGAMDHRVDIYSLGLVMFAMLAGKPPFTGSDVIKVLQLQQHEPAPRVASLAPDVPGELDELIARMLAKDPAARPTNALSLGRLLTAIAAVSTPASAPTTPLARRALSTAPDAAGHGVDLFAPTRGIPGRPEATPPDPSGRLPATRAATGMKADNTTKLPGAGSSSGTGVSPAAATVVERTPHNRFTTVAELDRLADKQAARDRRIEHRVQVVAVFGSLALFAAAGYLFFRKPTADEVFARIEADQGAIAAGDNLRDATPAIDDFLARFPEDPRTNQVRKMARSLAVDKLAKRARRRVPANGSLLPIERAYRAAMEREKDSPATCCVALESLIAVHLHSAAAATATTSRPQDDDPSLWIDLARRQVERLRPDAEKERKDDAKKIGEIFRRAATLAAEAQATSGAAREQLLAQRRELLESIITLYDDRAHAAEDVAAARRLLKQ